ncbi:MAG TPA: hypothetical protein VHO50_05625 [Bacteroidales bacterium]|nr:hypothetical protein [Bacteroidales bacterium]
MENKYLNLSEEEFSKSRKILLWIFSGLFFLAGMYVVVMNVVLGKESIALVLSTAPFSISLVVSIIAIFGSIKQGGQYFSVDNEKIEFRYGMFNPKKHSFSWVDINEIVMPQKQKKVLLHFNDGTSYILDLTWVQRKKSSLIRKHLYHAASERHLTINKVKYLKK